MNVSFLSVNGVDDDLFLQFLHGIESFKFFYSIIFLLLFFSFFAPIDRIIRSFDLKPRLGDLICWRLE